MNRKTLLSTLWIFVLLNMIYADILGMLKPGYVDSLEQLSQQLSGSVVLMFAVLMEVPIIMVVLSRVLAYRANRWAHFVTLPLTILWVVVPSLIPSLGDSTPLSYIFFVSVEVLTMVLMFWQVWTWPSPEQRHDRAW